MTKVRRFDRPMHNRTSYGWASPGAGPVDEQTSPERAAKNVAAFVKDLAGHTVTWEPLLNPDPIEDKLLMGGTRYSPTHDGRWPFRIFIDGRHHVLEMPGVPLKHVRYLGKDSGNCWDYPRVFIDGSSWLWHFGLRVITDTDDPDPWNGQS